LTSITPNYSGAALKSLCQMYTVFKGSGKLPTHELIKIAKTVGIHYKIKFGDETYP
jgi:hypothetical protein